MASFYVLSVALQVLVSFTFTNSQEFCATRRLSEWPSETQPQSTECPYHIDSHRWVPGDPVEMQLAGDLDFQSYLVSVQQGSQLIGNMSSDDSLSEIVCRDTSVKNADDTNKTIVEFSWSPPSDLDTTRDIFIRYSVGRNSEEFWVDCGGTILRSGENQEAAATTTEPAPTKDARVADPDEREGGPRQNTTPAAEQTTPTPTIATSASLENKCERSGITYSITPGTECQEFRMQWASGSSTMKCPEHTVFKIEDCVCSLAWQTNCVTP